MGINAIEMNPNVEVAQFTPRRSYTISFCVSLGSLRLVSGHRGNILGIVNNGNAIASR